MSRRRDVEFLRVVATFLVVWYHCPSELPGVAYSGLIFFVIASTYFSLLEAGAGEGGAGRRIGRLLRVWVVWVAVYAVVLLVIGKIDEYLYGPVGAMLLVGPSTHLWYLPFLAAVLFASPWLASVVSRLPVLVAVGALYAISLLLVDGWRPWAVGLGVPWAQYVHALPAVLLGMMFAAVQRLQSRRKAVFVVFALAMTVPAWHAPGVGITYFAGVALAAPILFPWRPVQLIDRVATLSKYMLGIYLVHPIMIRVARRALDADGLLLAAIGFALSLGLVAAVYFRFPRVARVVM